MPATRGASSAVAGRTRATLTVGHGGLRQSFTTENENRPAHDRDALGRRTVPPLQRRWRFAPLGSRGCQVEFGLHYEFASRALGTVLEPLFDNIADTMVDAFTRRADELYGQHPG